MEHEDRKLTCEINFSTGLLRDKVQDRYVILVCERCGKTIKANLSDLYIIAEGPYGQQLYGAKCECGYSTPFNIWNCDAYFAQKRIYRYIN